MNKTLIIVGVACFVLALAASTAVVVMRAPANGAKPDSVAVANAAHAHADSASAPAAATGAVVPPAGDGHAAAFEGDTTAPASEPDRMALAASVPHEAEVVTPTSTSHAEPPADYTRVAKILVNMKPAEAGAILEHLGDAQVEGVLRAVGPRQAATLLTALPAERAAQISKRLLVPVTEEKRP